MEVPFSRQRRSSPRAKATIRSAQLAAPAPKSWIKIRFTTERMATFTANPATPGSLLRLATEAQDVLIGSMEKQVEFSGTLTRLSNFRVCLHMCFLIIVTLQYVYF